MEIKIIIIIIIATDNAVNFKNKLPNIVLY